MKLEYRDAVTMDLTKFYGEPMPVTVNAVVITLDGEPVGVIGVANGITRSLFSDVKPALTPHLKSMTVLRAIKRAMFHVETSRKKVYAICQPGTDLIKRLGFKHVSDDVYQYGVN